MLRDEKGRAAGVWGREKNMHIHTSMHTERERGQVGRRNWKGTGARGGEGVTLSLSLSLSLSGKGLEHEEERGLVGRGRRARVSFDFSRR